ncbi:type II secretion system protein [bacterium]|nr:type II secretion system protein [bacterium]
MKFLGKKSGFTLSEVMITITLIGVLASLTISTVGSSVQQRARLSEFRAAYAKLDTALRNIVFTKGAVYACYDSPSGSEITDFALKIAEGTPTSETGQCTKFKEDFTRALGTVRTCETDVMAEGCLPDNYPIAGDNCFNSYSNSHAYVLDNSMIIFTNSGNNFGEFAMDVNGRKGPNKWGQDIFPFSVKPTESVKVSGNVYVKQIGILPGDNECSYANGGASKSTTQMMRESAGIR